MGEYKLLDQEKLEELIREGVSVSGIRSYFKAGYNTVLNNIKNNEKLYNLYLQVRMDKGSKHTNLLCVSNLGYEFKCIKCGKQFIVSNRADYTYKRIIKGKTVYYDKYTCFKKDEDK